VWLYKLANLVGFERSLISLGLIATYQLEHAAAWPAARGWSAWQPCETQDYRMDDEEGTSKDARNRASLTSSDLDIS